jgi:hypothetical protein
VTKHKIAMTPLAAKPIKGPIVKWVINSGTYLLKRYGTMDF